MHAVESQGTRTLGAIARPLCFTPPLAGRSCGPMLLDVLLKIRDEQDPSLVIKYGCRRGRCGACAAVVNGTSLLPCCTPVNKDVTGVR